MTNTFTVVTDTGRKFKFASEAAYEAAQAWFYTQSKRDIVDFVGMRGIVKKNGQLMQDWDLVAMRKKAGDSAAAFTAA